MEFLSVIPELSFELKRIIKAKNIYNPEEPVLLGAFANNPLGNYGKKAEDWYQDL